MKRFEAIVARMIDRENVRMRANRVYLRKRVHERMREKKLSSILRIKLVFTRLNFNPRLNSSPQLKRKTDG